MPGAREEQGDPASFGGGDDPGGEYPRPLVRCVIPDRRCPLLGRELEYLHRRVVVVQDLAASSLTDHPD
jgi:hypothetical protein